jgi:hypothetical protein
MTKIAEKNPHLSLGRCSTYVWFGSLNPVAESAATWKR